jgi:alpha-glucosidase
LSDSRRRTDWRDGVVYQIYPRSFQDTDGDGVGDLRGIVSRLDHLTYLGVDALWLSPIYTSPLADFGYDVSDHIAVDPTFGKLTDFDALVVEAHDRGLKVLLDFVPCHTSIEHPWFREHPDWYVWSDRDGPPNNWVSAFGGPAWSRDERTGRWYLHSFYAEQPDLDWHNPEVVAAMQAVLRFWVERGVDGFRIDAIDRLSKDPELRDDPPSSEPFGLLLLEHEQGRDLSHSRNWADLGKALRAIRDAAGDAMLIGEIYLPVRRQAPYLEHLDRAFVFELLQAPWNGEVVRAAVAAGLETLTPDGRGGPAWVLSNHDFGRLASRVGAANARAAALLLLTLPGSAFVYQGDEIGLENGPGRLSGGTRLPPWDRIGRDVFRHPMQWDPSARGGFTDGDPWLPLVDPATRNVAAQRDDPGSLLGFYRELIALHRELHGKAESVDLGQDVVAFRRGGHLAVVNLGADPCALPGGEVLVAAGPQGTPAAGSLPARAAAVLRE